MGWEPITDRKKLRRAEQAVGAELASLWEYRAEHDTPHTVHTRAFNTVDGRQGWLYTDGHIDWGKR